jgi:hypothetical protein
MKDILRLLEEKEAALKGKTEGEDITKGITESADVARDGRRKEKPGRCPTAAEAAAINLEEVRRAGAEWRRLHGFGQEGACPGV